MSTNVESSYTKDIVVTSQKSTIEDESYSSEENLMPVIGMEIGTNTHFERLTCFLELSEDDEIACENMDIASSFANSYLQARRWRHQDLKAFYEMNEFVDEKDFCDELEHEFEDLSDSEEDDESDCSDDLQDSIRLTRSRFSRERTPIISQNYHVIQNCRVE
jgi:hypothetical protein